MKFIYKSIFKLKALKAFIRLVKNPMDLEAVFCLTNDPRVASAEKFKNAFASIREDSDSQKLLDERYSPTWPTPSELEASTTGTLASEYYHFLKTYDLFKSYKFPKPISLGNDEVDFIRARIRKTHDLWHVLTGFDTSVEGEIGLQSFYLAQLNT